MKDISIVISGAAGQGVQTVEQLLVGILKMSGFNVFATKEYESRVRGGTNSTELRISTKRVAAFVNRIDLLVPFSKAAILHVKARLSEKTVILADEALLGEEDAANYSNLIKLPLQKTAIEVGKKIYSNVVSVGVITGLFGANPEIGKKFLQQRFQSKGETIIAQNHEAFDKGYGMGKELKDQGTVDFTIEHTEGVESEILFNGNQAVALGAIAGGCNFISAYPMSPSTGVLIYLAQHSEEFEIVIDQAEDEIAAINKTVAAWYAGARAIASTSGGGFALMGEGLSLAGIMETPLVIHIAQRPGPATGLPTRTAQEDLNLALYGGHGEFNRVIFAPGTIQQAFYLTQKAFNLADEFQVPIFVLTDQDFVDGYYNIPSLDISQLSNKKHIVETAENYKRYLLTENGISPRGVPGFGDGLVRADSDEHNEYGHITEDMEVIRPAMTEKRVFKRRKLLEKVAELPSLIPEAKYRTLVICWGSNYHVVKEGIAVAEKQGVSMLHFHQVYPLPEIISETIQKAEKVILIENNATGQFGKVLTLELGIKIPREQQYLRYSGKPWSVEEIVNIIQKEAL
ncbi:MAG: 2-oxoacid:acceptor oxidoreductase subunit alpha [Promethearchaeota archaeon]